MSCENRILSNKYRVQETHCLTAGHGKGGQTTNVYLNWTARETDSGRLVGLEALDLPGDRSDLAGKKLMITVEVIEEQP